MLSKSSRSILCRNSRSGEVDWACYTAHFAKTSYTGKPLKYNQWSVMISEDRLNVFGNRGQSLDLGSIITSLWPTKWVELSLRLSQTIENCARTHSYVKRAAHDRSGTDLEQYYRQVIEHIWVAQQCLLQRRIGTHHKVWQLGHCCTIVISLDSSICRAWERWLGKEGRKTISMAFCIFELFYQSVQWLV